MTNEKIAAAIEKAYAKRAEKYDAFLKKLQKEMHRTNGLATTAIKLAKAGKLKEANSALLDTYVDLGGYDDPEEVLNVYLYVSQTVVNAMEEAELGKWVKCKICGHEHREEGNGTAYKN